MALFDRFSKKTEAAPVAAPVVEKKPLATVLITKTDATTKEAGEVSRKPAKWPLQDLGEAHPFDCRITEGLLRVYGFVDAILDRYVNYIWGRGFTVRPLEEGTNADKAVKLITDFNREAKLSIVGRAWVKEALHKPGGYMEAAEVNKQIVGLKLRGGETVYIKRDAEGNITGYNQYLYDMDKAGFDKKKIIALKMENIVPLHFNVMGTDAYGMGLVWPNIKTIDEIRGLETSMHKIIKRKANSPMHIKIGNKETGEMPTPETIDAVKQELNTLTDKTELVSDQYWDINVVDFGKVGEKFKEVYDIDYYRLIAGLKMYEVLLGKGNIAEGLGDVQAEDLQLTIESMREQVETALEDLYTRILARHNINIKLEVEWLPTNKQKTDKINQILAIMPTVQPAMRFELEKQLAHLMEVDPSVLKTPEQQMAARAEETGMMQKAADGEMPPKEKPENPEEAKRVPQLPGENNPKASLVILTDSESSGAVPNTVTAPHTATYSAHAAPEAPSTLNPFRDNCPVKEWVGFNFDEFLVHILAVLKKDGFSLLKASNELEKAAGYLTDKQVAELRAVLEEGFTQGQTIRELADNIYERVAPGPVYRIEGNQVGTVALHEADRVLNIARSETVRVANLASQDYYVENNIEQVRWIASLGDRTCAECEGMNGTIMETNKATLPPLHSMCRCTIAAVTKYG